MSSETFATSDHSLRAVQAADLPVLYEMAVGGRFSASWRFRGIAPSFDEFVAGFAHDVLFQMVIIDPRSANHVVGHLVCYGADSRNGFAYLAALLEDGVVGASLGDAALVEFAREVFLRWPLRKLYAEVPDRTKRAVESARGVKPGGFAKLSSVEGHLRQHWYSQGEYEDIWITSVTREGVLGAS